MFEIEAVDGRTLAYSAVTQLLAHGVAVSPRGQLTHEFSPAHLVLRDPTDAFPTGIGREKLSAALATCEALQLVAGVSTPELLCRIAPFYANFLEDDGRQWGAYGPRLRAQLPIIVERLKRDSDTRQAVCTIYSQLDTFREECRDYPCTLSLHFLLREGRLDLHVTMRSNDAWLGLPYDLFQFTQVQCTVARALGVPLGTYHHHASSLHLYQRDFTAASALTPPKRGERVFGEAIRVGVGHDGQPWEVLATRAHKLLLGQRIGDPTDDEAWFAEQLAPFLTTKEEACH